MLSAVEQARLTVSIRTAPGKKSQLGQFLTPESVASFMAQLFPETSGGVCRLLDAGAGIGSLSHAFLNRCMTGQLRFNTVDLAAFELDVGLHDELRRTLNRDSRADFCFEIVGKDFIEEAVNSIQFGQQRFTHAILNPPYKKIGSHSRQRLLLRQVGIETVNLYSAFVALALLQMTRGGQLVAILPRSFCNGPYYRPFRNLVMEHAAIRHIHLFGSRSQAFKDDDVLQENVIIRLERGGLQGEVTITTSTDDSFCDLVAHQHPFERIVLPNDPERFIHVPTAPGHNAIEQSTAVRYSLADIGVSVSTGPVVDFRLQEHLLEMPAPGAVPLLYPVHFAAGKVKWPMADIKKPNAIQRNADTEKWLYPNGFYCVVRRFSSKEESRRIVASVVDPTVLGDAPMLGLENHLNVYHERKQGLPEALARGLAIFLNSTAVDENFRRFNGHTQVNATDLKLMKYPSREALLTLGLWAQRVGEPTQSMIDEQFTRLDA